ncbi:ribosome small subunit-dependent GTPase A [Nitrosomonas sp. ANs5]|uniref:ribosome small subunit-dependent GTPase A n=1 Tax=Nitrosomonas sp. ANs5 TaxID=3423941 RepID=UPI003D32657A
MSTQCAGRKSDSSHRLVGQITAAYGRRYDVETSAGIVYSCVMRGKKTGVACGDRVEFLLTAADQGVIETILPRTSLFYRSDAFREKLIAANVTQLVFVIAAIPSFDLELLDRCLMAAESQDIQPLILLNKADLTEPSQAARQALGVYQALGYPLLEISARITIEPLIPYLSGQTSLFAGQSGMGKSTLLNALIPEARQTTAEISDALDSGRHTTTHARLFRLDADSYIIDSPGFQEFGLHQLNEQSLAWGFVEFRPYLGQCRFRNCRHLAEPGCAVLEAVQAGTIHARRMACYHKLLRGSIKR